MRSLWSGVSGLQAHQIAMDVEGNNIANVNTYGFKYNRANFADILSQTPRVATAPQGQLGGQNAMQIGLGTTINSTTRIFSQGTLTATDKQTDLALQEMASLSSLQMAERQDTIQETAISSVIRLVTS